MHVTAGIDLGGTAVNYTFITTDGRWLIDGLCEHPARPGGPWIRLQIADGLAMAVAHAGISLDDIAVVGLDDAGPATAAACSARADPRISFTRTGRGFDIRQAWS